MRARSEVSEKARKRKRESAAATSTAAAPIAKKGKKDLLPLAALLPLLLSTSLARSTEIWSVERTREAKLGEKQEGS